MSTIRTRTARTATGLTALALFVPLSGCSGDQAPDVSGSAETSAEETAAEETAAEDTAAGTSPPAATPAPSGESGVDCTGNSCSVTLSGDGAEVDVLGNTISLGQVQDGRATIGVGEQEVSCTQGEEVSAGPLTLECTTVDPGGVTLTASLG